MCLDHIINGIRRARRKVILNPRESSSGCLPFPLLLLFSLLYIILSLGRSLPIRAIICSRHPSESVLIQRGIPSIARPVINETSSSVTVISPVRRWKLWVSGLHRSTRADTSGAFRFGVDRLTNRIHGSSPACLMYGVYRSS